jgi:hypothetical protein
VYDPLTHIWETKADLIKGLNAPGVAVLNGKIYVIGGNNHNNAVQVYDPETDIWTTKSNIPYNTSYTSAVELDGYIYLMGGSGSTLLNPVIRYNHNNDTWVPVTNMLTPRFHFGAVALNGKIYVAGGSDGSSYLNSLEVYTPDLLIPSSPTNLTATAGNAQVTLNWSAVTGATGYNVKRSTTPGGPYSTVAENVYGTTYLDTAVVNGTTYYYVVTAINAGGESANSNEASATPQGAPVSQNRALLVVTLVSGLEKEYDLSMTEVSDFIAWYNGRAVGTGPEVYTINKTFNKANFLNRKDYIAFSNIEMFEENEYIEQ